MNPEALIREAVCLPTNAIAYHVSERLVALFPEKAIVQGDNSIFDVDEYARAQLCGFEKKAIPWKRGISLSVQQAMARRMQ